MNFIFSNYLEPIFEGEMYINETSEFCFTLMKIYPKNTYHYDAYNVTTGKFERWNYSGDACTKMYIKENELFLDKADKPVSPGSSIIIHDGSVCKVYYTFYAGLLNVMLLLESSDDYENCLFLNRDEFHQIQLDKVYIT